MTSAPENSDRQAPLVSIVIPSYNESDNIEATIRAVFEHVRAPVEVVIVDDNSPDGTAGVVEGMNDPRVILIKRARGRGLASAIMRGILESNGEIIGRIDADMATETQYFPAMIEKNNEHDVVVASRFVDGGGDERHFVRIWASYLINGFANLILGIGIKDYDSCVFTVRRPVFDDVMIIPYGFGDFFIEFIYQCLRRGYSVVEHPYVLCARDGGKSKSAPDLRGFLWLGFKYCVRVVATKLRPD